MMQTVLFLVCTIPFWTSNVIRMISWIPFLGRNGLLNQALMGIGAIDQPLEFLLFSNFAVVLAYVHLYALFMVVPIFNSMVRIDRALIEAARDAGATEWQVLRNGHHPAGAPGHRHRLDPGRRRRDGGLRDGAADVAAGNPPRSG